MTNVWNYVQSLNKTTLYTIYQQKPFDIVDILPDRIVFKPQNGKGTPRWINRTQIERLYELIKAGQDVDRKFVQKLYPSDYNTSYIVAIVRAIDI